jgi:hypothetical protein
VVDVTRTGVDDPWRDEGGDEPLEGWIAAGFSAAEAEAWRGWRIRLAEARAWRHVGVTEAIEAAQWSTAGATPHTMRRWQGAGIDATEAVLWHEFGFDVYQAEQHTAQGRRPIDAFEQRAHPHGTWRAYSGRRVTAHPAGGTLDVLLDAGVPHHIVADYATHQWLDDEARAWALEHVAVADARLWRLLGVRPREAVRAAARGVTPEEAVREWWRAGIPVDEVADWLGAGLTATEAAAQRAKGVTSAQAAALRALRDGADET